MYSKQIFWWWLVLCEYATCSIKLLKTYSCHGLKSLSMPTVTQLYSVPKPHVFSQYVALFITSSLCTVLELYKQVIYISPVVCLCCNVYWINNQILWYCFLLHCSSIMHVCPFREACAVPPILHLVSIDTLCNIWNNLNLLSTTGSLDTVCVPKSMSRCQTSLSTLVMQKCSKF